MRNERDKKQQEIRDIMYQVKIIKPKLFPAVSVFRKPALERDLIPETVP